MTSARRVGRPRTMPGAAVRTPFARELIHRDTLRWLGRAFGPDWRPQAGSALRAVSGSFPPRRDVAAGRRSLFVAPSLGQSVSMTAVLVVSIGNSFQNRFEPRGRARWRQSDWRRRGFLATPSVCRTRRTVSLIIVPADPKLGGDEVATSERASSISPISTIDLLGPALTRRMDLCRPKLWFRPRPSRNTTQFECHA
jgi:hypothetical protein